MKSLWLQEVRERRRGHRGTGPEDGVTADEGPVAYMAERNGGVEELEEMIPELPGRPVSSKSDKVILFLTSST